MRKSLGEKRRYIADEDIEEITRLHGAVHEEDPRVKLVPMDAFGYRAVTVERPLCARWEITRETWAEVEAEPAITKLGAQSSALVDSLRRMPRAAFHDESQGRARIREAATSAGLRPSSGLLKTLVARCLVRDSDAPEVRDQKGRFVADSTLRRGGSTSRCGRRKI
jgi:type I restriction enzyme M protein